VARLQTRSPKRRGCQVRTNCGLQLTKSVRNVYSGERLTLPRIDNSLIYKAFAYQARAMQLDWRVNGLRWRGQRGASWTTILLAV
jgi:hypothetical protein